MHLQTGVDMTSDLRTAAVSSLALIDVGGLSSPNLAVRQAVADEMRAACLGPGFFYIRNHGIAAGLVDAVMAETKAFFGQAVDAKAQVAKTRSPCNRGWEPLRAQALEPGTAPDLKESFYLGRELASDHPSVVAGKFNHGPNQWPAALPGFRPMMRAYYEAMLDLSERMMRGLALSLGLAEDYFDAFMREPMATLRLLHYPPHPADAPENQRGAGAHTDYGVLTFLLQDANGGLQVHDAATGRWIDAAPVPGSYVVNLGDTIARWTNDRYHSTLHRVINASGQERYSVPFFFNGNADHVVSCLPGCLAQGEAPKYRPNTVAGHMAEMYGRSYAIAS